MIQSSEAQCGGNGVVQITFAGNVRMEHPRAVQRVMDRNVLTDNSLLHSRSDYAKLSKDNSMENERAICNILRGEAGIFLESSRYLNLYI